MASSVEMHLDEPTPSKRALQGAETSAKKRRKQSKPLRFGGAESGDSDEPDAPLNLSAPHRPWNPYVQAANVVPTLLFPPGHSNATVAAATTTNTAAQIRIFNPDAYCELCNKEFCNKYFLKTHKANKHGIYVESVGGKQNGGPPFAGLPLPLPSPSPSPTLTKPSDIGIFYKTALGGGPEAYCDICHKKFCNKYFVRRHKSKIHGIFEDGPVPHEASLFAAGAYQKLDFEDLGCVEGQAPKEEIAVDLEAVQDTGLDEDAGVLDQDRRAVESQENMNLAYKCSNSLDPFSANSALFSVDKLRKLGVINADAFCEICCKEYCNKYFLRTHKLKRHGIMTNDDLNGPRSGNVPWNLSQTCPLNLIVNEQGTNSSDSAEKSRTELSDSDDPECDVCGRRFQSAHLMKMHRAYLHVDKEKPRPEEETKPVAVEADVGAASYNDNNNGQGNGDSISEDLRKLQTMILQLNSLNVNNASNCHICNRDFENAHAHKLHMLAEHGVLFGDDNFADKMKPPSENASSPAVADPQTFCVSCNKDFPTSFCLKRHREECHLPQNGAPPPGPVKEEPAPQPSPGKHALQANNQIVTEKRISLTPTSSYCEICNKELCNKYFMKTHMQRMHGIEIENGAQIGGVICDICNKELCSKYFLRVHKQNTHGIVDDATSVRDVTGSSPSTSTADGDQALKPTELKDLSHRYFTHFTEACPVCDRRFRSTKWLKAHLLNDHGEVGVEKWKEMQSQFRGQPGLSKPQTKQFDSTLIDQGNSRSAALKIPGSWGDDGADGGNRDVLSNLFGTTETCVYNCSLCPFTTHALALLFVHERTHSNAADHGKPFQCPVCPQRFERSEFLRSHLQSHQFPGFPNQSAPKAPEEDEAAEDGDVKRALQDAAAKTRVPATYAVPQSLGRFIMQPFLLEEDLGRKFVPSVVFLPVKERLSEPLTVAFTLTPA